MKGVTMNKKITALICAPPSCSMAYMTTKTPLDPYAKNSSAGMFMSADIGYTDGNDPAAKSKADGAWIYVRGADFGYGASAFTADVKGKGRIEVRLDSISGEAVSFIEFDNADYAKVRSAEFSVFLF